MEFIVCMLYHVFYILCFAFLFLFYCIIQEKKNIKLYPGLPIYKSIFETNIDISIFHIKKAFLEIPVPPGSRLKSVRYRVMTCFLLHECWGKRHQQTAFYIFTAAEKVQFQSHTTYYPL